MVTARSLSSPAGSAVRRRTALESVAALCALKLRTCLDPQDAQPVALRLRQRATVGVGRDGHKAVPLTLRELPPQPHWCILQVPCGQIPNRAMMQRYK
eukprot:360045-Chlamydomonas_euryale.AAC.12